MAAGFRRRQRFVFLHVCQPSLNEMGRCLTRRSLVWFCLGYIHPSPTPYTHAFAPSLPPPCVPLYLATTPLRKLNACNPPHIPPAGRSTAIAATAPPPVWRC